MADKEKVNYFCLRLAGFYVDAIISQLLSLLIVYIISLFQENIFDSNIGIAFESLIMLIIVFFYFLIMEFFFSRTIGKFIIGMKVISEKNNDLNFFQIFIRTICRTIPFEPISIFFDKNGTMWHDKISKTRVVKIKNK